MTAGLVPRQSGRIASSEIVEIITSTETKIKMKESKAKMADVKCETWPWNLMEALNINEERDPLERFDDIGNMIVAMQTVNLTNREKLVLEYRYQDMLSLEETGKKFGVTRERVRQVEAKVLRKMMSPTPWYILNHGAKAYVDKRIQEAVAEKTERIRRELIAELEQKYSEKMTELSGKVDALEGFKMEVLDTPIECLDLSVRSFNCLKRARCNTVGDIVSMFPCKEDVWNIRNLGRKSMEEIQQKLARMSVKWPKEDAE